MRAASTKFIYAMAQSFCTISSFTGSPRAGLYVLHGSPYAAVLCLSDWWCHQTSVLAVAELCLHSVMAFCLFTCKTHGASRLRVGERLEGDKQHSWPRLMLYHMMSCSATTYQGKEEKLFLSMFPYNIKHILKGLYFSNFLQKTPSQILYFYMS